MRTPLQRRLTLALVLAGVFTPLLLSAAPKEPKRETLQGKVVPLAGLVQQIGSQLDPDAAPNWLALVTNDGKIYPLIKDSGSRMFFKDSKLLNRPMRLTGSLLPGSQLLQVVNVQSLLKGQPHDVYYWCEICSIRRSEKNICECCGRPMELREVPLKK